MAGEVFNAPAPRWSAGALPCLPLALAGCLACLTLKSRASAATCCHSAALVWPEGDDVDLVQKVGRRRVGGITHNIYDVVMTSGTRWWVITHNTNLYPQSDFKSMDQAFTYHLGLMRVLNEQFKTQPDELQVEYVSRPWRRLRSAFDAMDDAEEAEDYQAVGMRCREALVTLAREHQGAEWVRMPEEQPKADDAKNWLRIYADSLTTSRPRDYMRALVERTWGAG